MPDLVSRLQTALQDRYRLEREIGAGGMATVFVAQDLRHDRRVALKVLRPELAAVIGAERFLAEIRLTANLQHPHILPLFDSGAADSYLFYVMPFVEGETLRDRLNREKQLSVADTVRIATEVASALDYAHRHGVIHRDIKPENVLLHDGHALVADFGIALAASKASGSRMTDTGMSLGTPHYMSPEQATGEREITASLGCVRARGRGLRDAQRGAALHRHHRPGNRGTGADRGSSAARSTATHGSPPPGGGGADRAGEASGRPFPHGGGLRRGAPGQDLREHRPARRARCGSRGGPSPGGSRRNRALPSAWVTATALTAVAALWGWLRPVPSAAREPVSPGASEGPVPPAACAGWRRACRRSPPTAARWSISAPAPSGSRLWLRRLDQLRATPIPGSEGGLEPVLLAGWPAGGASSGRGPWFASPRWTARPR